MDLTKITLQLFDYETFMYMQTEHKIKLKMQLGFDN